MRSVFLLAAVLLAGCATSPALKILDITVDPGELVRFDSVMDGTSRRVLCPKCLQDKIHPRFARDKKGTDMLVWSCENCLAIWCSRPATDVKTIP